MDVRRSTLLITIYSVHNRAVLLLLRVYTLMCMSWAEMWVTRQRNTWDVWQKLLLLFVLVVVVFTTLLLCTISWCRCGVPCKQAMTIMNSKMVRSNIVVVVRNALNAIHTIRRHSQRTSKNVLVLTQCGNLWTGSRYICVYNAFTDHSPQPTAYATLTVTYLLCVRSSNHWNSCGWRSYTSISIGGRHETKTERLYFLFSCSWFNSTFYHFSRQ